MRSFRIVKAMVVGIAAVTIFATLTSRDVGAQAAAGEATPTLTLTDSTAFVRPNATVTATFATSGLQPTDIIEWGVHERIFDDEVGLQTAVAFTIVAANESPLEAFGEALSTPSRVLAGFALKADGSLTLPITLTDNADAPDGVFLDEPGIYPLAISVLRSDETVASTYALFTLLPTDGAPLQIISIANGPVELSTLPDGKISFSSDTARGLRSLVEQIEQDDDGLLGVALRGETVNAMFVSDERTMNDLGRRLRATLDNHTLIRQPYSYMHLGAWAAQKENPDLIISLATSAAMIADKLGELPSQVVAPPDASISNQAAVALQQTGTKAMVLDPSAVPIPLESPLALRTGATAPLSNGSSAPVFWVDRDLSSMLPATESRLDIQNFLALTSGAAFDASKALPATDSRLAILDVPPSTPASTLATIFSEFGTGSPLLAPTSVDALATFQISATVNARVDLVDTPAEIMGTFPQTTNRTRQLLNAYRNTVGDRDPTAKTTDQLLLLSTTLGLDTERRDAFVSTVRLRAKSWLSNISFERPGPITITSQEAEIPLRFVNTSGYPAAVQLRFDSKRIELIAPAAEKPTVDVAPGESTIRVKVRMRSSGQFTIPLEVRSFDGTEIITKQRLTIRSAAFSGVGVALSIASLVVLAAWWIKTHRRNRRLAAAVETGAVSTLDGPPRRSHDDRSSG